MVSVSSDSSPSLLDRVRATCQRKGYSYRTGQPYTRWIVRYVKYHDTTHPRALDKQDVRDYLSYLATGRNLAASTQNQALNALLFLYRDVPGREWKHVGDFERAKEPGRLPVVLTPEEVKALLGAMEGPNGLVAHLLYGAGLRLSEALRLRVKDLDFDYEQIVVRQGKGKKDRTTVFPASLKGPLRRQLGKSRTVWEEDRAAGYGTASMPTALDRKSPNAAEEWGWKYVFPSASRSEDPRSGKTKRHHRSPSAVQKAVKRAVRAAGITEAASCHTLRPERSEEVVSDCGIRLRPTSWPRAPISALSRTFWGTKTCTPHRFTPACSNVGGPVRKAHLTPSNRKERVLTRAGFPSSRGHYGRASAKTRQNAPDPAFGGAPAPVDWG